MNPNMRRKPKAESRVFRISRKDGERSENNDQQSKSPSQSLTREKEIMRKNKKRLDEIEEKREVRGWIKEVWE